MAKISRESDEVNARIVYWGVEGSGKSANLHAAYAKLRPDHRGEMRVVPSRLDPTVAYELLPIQLGEVAGIRTQIEMIAVPGGPEQAPTRKQLLDQVDGIVFVADASPDRLAENLASWAELQNTLASYGRSLSDIPLVVQYNKRDQTDAFALEDLHRKLDPGGAAVFEAVASEATGVLQTLSTISKRVIRALREHGPAAPDAAPAPAAAAPAPTAAAPAPTPPPRSPAERMERAILEEPGVPDRAAVEATARQAETLLERPWTHVPGEISRPPGAVVAPNLTILSVGEATRAGDRSVRVPLVLGDGEGGSSTLVLTIQLDALVDEDVG